MSSGFDLTICTVSFRHKEIIETNMAWVEKMNPRVSVRWIVVENTPEGDPGCMELGTRGALTVLPGISNTWTGVGAASRHHASGVNRALQEVETQYVVVLDPDVYIVRKDGLRAVLSHMKENSLGFFGLPYNPKRYAKYRYFPCVHGVFIDLRLVPLAEIDFSPSYAESNSKPQSRATPGLGTKFKTFLRFMVRRSGAIGASRDTGYLVYKKFYESGVRSECVVPVFKIRESGMVPSYLGSRFNQFLEFFLPDRISYIPKRGGAYSSLSFKERGYPDAYGAGWDEFLWEDKPFAFHLTGTLKDGISRDHGGEMNYLKEVLEGFL